MRLVGVAHLPALSYNNKIPSLAHLQSGHSSRVRVQNIRVMGKSSFGSIESMVFLGKLDSRSIGFY